MKCIFTAAGLGTRLLPLTKDLPKEMLPIYDISRKGELIFKPFLQLVYEQLYRYKIRDFCFILGNSKRLVQEHFTPDFDLTNYLKNSNKRKLAAPLEEFFKMLENSNIVFVYQPKPIGFGDAIYRSKKFVGNESFLLHAGDDVVLSKNNNHLKRLEEKFRKHDAELACLVEEVSDPSHYGVVKGPLLEKGVIEIKKIIEKPKKTKSFTAVIAIYMFKPTIFKYLEMAQKKGNPEKQLDIAYKIAIKKNAKVIAVKLNKNEKRIDIGNPESYTKVLLEYKKILKTVKNHSH